MEIKRELYLNRLIVRKHNGMIKVVTGIRRCGKSYLLNMLFYHHLLESGVPKDHILRFAFDSAEDLKQIGENFIEIYEGKKKADAGRFMDYVANRVRDEGQYYLLLDEVQYLSGFEGVLNSFLHRDNVDVYVTGSNSKFLSSDIITEFAGRGDEVRVYPLTFSEYYSVYDGSKDEAFDEYMTYGGLPAVALMQTEEQKSTYLMAQMKNVYLRDIVLRHNLSSDKAIEELVDLIASDISCLVNPKKLADTFRSMKGGLSISETTIDRYISHLEDAFIISRAKRYDVKGKRYIGTPYKLYFEDVGLRNARLHFRQPEETHLMENIIYNELRVRGYQVDVGVVEVRERENGENPVRKTYEIDFVANMGNKRSYIQSAYAIPDEEKRRQETKSFDNIGDSFRKFILVEKTMKPRYDENGYIMMGVREFLLDAHSLDT